MTQTETVTKASAQPENVRVKTKTKLKIVGNPPRIKLNVELWRYIMWLRGSDPALLTPSENEHLKFWDTQLEAEHQKHLDSVKETWPYGA